MDNYNIKLQRLATSVRSRSLSKPQVTSLRALGMDIRTSDWQTDGPEVLDQLLSGSYIVISTVNSDSRGSSWPENSCRCSQESWRKMIHSMRFQHCSRAWRYRCIQRGKITFNEIIEQYFWPRTLARQILEIRKYIEDSGVPHTYIDVRFWY